ncbi:MAG: mechanosensitive ion channel [Luteolibacter sp.]
MIPRPRSLSFLLALLFLTQPAFPQLQQLEKLAKGATSQPADSTPTAPPDDAGRIRKNLADARAALAALPADPDAAPPEGMTSASVMERRLDLDQLIRTLNRHLSLLTAGENAHNDFNKARETLKSWNGFDTAPPYSVLLVDELATRLETLNEKRASYESSLRTIENVRKDGTFTRDTTSPPDRESPGNGNSGETAKKNASNAALKQQLAAARAESVKSNLDLLHTQLKTNQLQIDLVGKQLALARRNYQFSDADLAKLQTAADDHQAAIKKEIAAIAKKQKAAQDEKIRARRALDTLLAAHPADTPDSPEIEFARFTLEAAESKAESYIFITENLGNQEELGTYPITAYESRRILQRDASRKARDEAFESLITLRDRLAAWEIVNNNQLAAVNADLSQLNNTAATLTGNDPRVSIVADQRAVLWEKQNFLQRQAQAIASHRKSLDRWIRENEKGALKSLGAHIEDAAASTWTTLQNIWKFPVAKYNVNLGYGQTEERPVTLGSVILALVFFGVSYYIAARLSRRLQRLAVRRVHIGEAQANTLRNWLMILVGVGLAIATLNFLSIPLTLFAFVGGALAIGLGFGTQTLIKNFISGIIVLFERKIRIGDIIDLGGLSGTIIEINTRSSVLRGGDGKETLVPNSLFLENRVTNLTLNNRQVRKFITVRTEYGTPPQQVLPLLMECLERHGLILKTPAPVVTLEDFSDAGLVFGMYYWTEFNSKTNGDVVASDVRIMIEKRFAEAGVKMPTPARDHALRTDKPLQLEISRPHSEPEPPSQPASTRELP